jgi:Zn-dependent peptidase ImmA (M78 family)
MDAIGISISRLPVTDLRKVRDLEYYEGPVLSEFHSRTGGTYLFSWCDMDARAHRWLVFRIGKDALSQFLQGRVSLREVVLGAQEGFVYLVDIGEEQRYQRVALLSSHELPASYVPGERSFFDPALMPGGRPVVARGVAAAPETDIFGDRAVLAFELRSLPRMAPEGDPVAAATWADLRIWLGGHNVTRHVPEGAEVLSEGVRGSAFDLALWFVRSWSKLFEQQVWPLPGSFRNARDVRAAMDKHLGELEELATRHKGDAAEVARFAAVRDAFVRAHGLATSSPRIPLPEMYIARDGARISIALRAGTRQAGVEFLHRAQDRDVAVPLFLAAVRGLVLWVLERLRGVDAAIAADEREMLSTWLSRAQTPAAAEAALFGYLGVEEGALTGALSAGSKQVALARLFELDPSWANEGMLFDPSRSGVAMVFRALRFTLTPAEIFAIVERLKQYPRSPRADQALQACQVELPPLERLKDFEHGYQLAESFRAQIGNRTGYFDVEAWLREAGIAVEDLAIGDPGVDGGAVWDDAHGPVIIVNTSSLRASTSWGRRMVLAHELCHLLVDHDAAVPLKIMSGPWAPPVLERRANAFAAELLLPRDGIVELIGIPPSLPDEETRRRLMDEFRVGEIVCVEHVQNRFSLRRW